MHKINNIIYSNIFAGWTLLGALFMFIFSATEVEARTGLGVQGLAFVWYGICVVLCWWVRSLVGAIYEKLREGIKWEVRAALAKYLEDELY